MLNYYMRQQNTGRFLRYSRAVCKSCLIFASASAFRIIFMQKKLRKFDVFALVVGTIIGWGSFTLPQEYFLPVSQVINTGIGLFLGVAAVLFVEKGYYIMIKNTEKEDGGEFSYTYRYLGKKHGFIVGWSLSLCYLSLVPLNATAFVLVFKIIIPQFSRIYLYTIAGFAVYLTDILLAWLIIIVFTYINIKGIRISTFVQNILILALIINIAVILVMMLTNTDLQAFKRNYIDSYRFSITQILSIFAIVPFLFVGFDVIVQVSTDIGFARQKTSRIAVIGILSGAAVYSILNSITALAYSLEDLQGKNWALGEGVLQYAGTTAFALLTIALLAAVSGGINGFMLSSSKLLGAISQYQLIPSRYKLQNKAKVYANSILFIAFVSMLAPFFGRKVIIYIVDLCSVLAALTYAYVCFIGIRLAGKKFGKITSGIGFIISLSFILLLIIPASPVFLSIPSLLFMAVWALLGLGYYYMYAKNKNQSVYK